MADTGVPQSISKSYADPSQGYQFLGRVLPEAAQVAEGQKRTEIASQAQKTTEFNANTARLGEMRMTKAQDMVLQRQALEHELDAALFDTKIEQSKAQLQYTRFAAEASQAKLRKETTNDIEGGSLMQWMDQLPLEGMANDEFDQEFGQRVSRLVGVGAKSEAIAAWHAHKGQVLQLSAPVIESRVGPDIWKNIQPHFEKATGTGRALLAQVADQRHDELVAMQEAERFKETVGVVAPGLHASFDLRKYYLDDDKYGNPRFDAFAAREDVAQQTALINRQSLVVSGLKKEIDENVSVKARENQTRAKLLVDQKKSVDSNLAKLAAARGTGAPDAMKEMLAAVVEKSFADKGLVDPAKIAAAQSGDKEVRDKAQAEIFQVVGAAWQAEQKLLGEELTKVALSDPATDLYNQKRAVKEAASNVRTIEKLVAKGAVPPERLKAAQTAAQEAYDALNATAGSDTAHTLYDGTFLVDPDRLTYPTPATK